MRRSWAPPKDIDLVLHDSDAELARTLERAVTDQDYQGFIFRRKGEPLDLDNGTVSMQLAVTYQGDAWTSITVDLARSEPGEEEVELVPAIALRDAFGITGPADLPVIPLRMHVAQKLHGSSVLPHFVNCNARRRYSASPSASYYRVRCSISAFVPPGRICHILV